jgi:uroporphyrin-III C-methyltransferase/precorrin-2 dehydrogenase/sirohydrochlorin ferrochelatase
MNHLPIFLDVKGQKTAVVGGGVAAARRAETLLKAGARVTAFAAVPAPQFDAFANHPSLTMVGDEPRRPEDFRDFRVCIVATDDAAKDARMHALAKAAGVLTNVAAHPELCDFLLPAIIDRDPVTIAISTGAASPILARRLRAQLETAIPSGYGRLAEFVRAQPAGENRRGGAGPGDPDLLTFRALRLMQQADVVLYDRLVDPAILDLVRREAERVYVGKRPRDHVAPQGEISEMLVRFAKEGKRVLRLKGGDPFVFGRGGEEIETLAEQGVPFQVCPGITAAIGCSAYSGIPLTHRDHAQACVFVTAHGKDGPIARDWKVLARPGQTVAIYMGLGHIEETMSDFAAAGVDPQTPAAIIDNGARPNQRVVVATVESLAKAARDAGLRGPTIIIVGSVVTLREKLNWNADGVAPDGP